ncbi:MAG TPA: hypothetical protein VF092_16030 [Longimicrobium sp.]
MTAPNIPAGAVLLAERLSPWETAINGKMSGLLVAKSVDTSRANTATYASDPHLSVAVAANAVVDVEVHGLYQAGATGQMKFQFTFPSGGQMDAASWRYDPGTDEWAAVVGLPGSSPLQFVTGLIGTGGNVPFTLSATLFNGSNAGSLVLQWAQTVSNATATILRRGTKMRVTSAA